MNKLLSKNTKKAINASELSLNSANNKRSGMPSKDDRVREALEAYEFTRNPANSKGNSASAGGGNAPNGSNNVPSSETQLALDKLLANAGYSTANKEKAENLRKQYEGIGDFKFSLDGNALYDQYKDHYTKQAKTAMDDAIGRASALSGGYGNSYAQTAGQQAYHSRMDDLNDIIPTIYSQAYGEYRDKKNDLLSQAQYYDSLAREDYDNALTLAMSGKLDKDYSQILTDAMKAGTIDAGGLQSLISLGAVDADTVLKLIASGKVDSKLLSGLTASNATEPTALDIDKTILERLATARTDSELDAMLEAYRDAGLISDYQMGQYKLANSTQNVLGKLDERNWRMTDNGGLNWFFGIDENGKVKDDYGNEYRLDELRDMLIEEYMANDASLSAKEAKKKANAYVKDLQKKVGITWW